MYDELVKRIQIFAQWADKGLRIPPSICLEAADAIEDLSSTVNAQRDILLMAYGGETGIKQMEEYAGKYWDALAKIPRWVPVTELLPEESEGLRWCEELTLRFTSVWCCDVNTGTIEVRNRLQGKKTGIDGLDKYMKDTDWHWSQSWWEPTHWMPIVPLPEQPKEET